MKIICNKCGHYFKGRRTTLCDKCKLKIMEELRPDEPVEVDGPTAEEMEEAEDEAEELDEEEEEE